MSSHHGLHIGSHGWETPSTQKTSWNPPVEIGETWRQGITTFVLLVTGNEAKETCGIDQLFAGMASEIEGRIHAINHMWKIHSMEEEWGFLLTNASNASNMFNEQNQTGLLIWTAWHKWPSGA
jgi:hypothetical protein